MKGDWFKTIKTRSNLICDWYQKHSTSKVARKIIVFRHLLTKCGKCTMECIRNTGNAQWNAFEMREKNNGMHSKYGKCTMECIRNAGNEQWNAFEMREMHNGMHSKYGKCTMECIQNMGNAQWNAFKMRNGNAFKIREMHN